MVMKGKQSFLVPRTLIALALVAGATGCASKDYLDPVRVRVVNDTGEPVRTYQCGDEECNGYRDEGTVLAPEESVEVQTDDQGTPNPYKVVSTDGDVLGCLPLIFDGRPAQEPVVVGVSEAGACRASYD